MQKGILSLIVLLGCVPLGCAITDYSPWPGHKTQGDAKLPFTEIAFTGIDPKLDGTYAYTVQYDHSAIPIGAFPTISITSWHNNGGTITSAGAVLPPAFNPDGMADRNGHLNGEFGSYHGIAPWTPDQPWTKYFVSVDTDGDCQFSANVKVDNSGSAFGPGVMLCQDLPSEEVGDIQELEAFGSLDQLFGQIWSGSLASSFTLNVTAISFDGVEHAMTSPLSVGLKNTGMRPSSLSVDFTTPAGRELLQSILNGTIDKTPARLSMRFGGGLKFSLPSAWKVAFNHAVIRKALGQ